MPVSPIFVTPVKEDVKSITNGYVTEFGDKDTSPAVSNVVPVKVVFVNAFEAKFDIFVDGFLTDLFPHLRK